ncbi:hypothetical protein ALC57_02077 [Trachymyrmex cornetzi]|uniref:DNA-directed DNA polymerase n=1 Tax=Trachymyrmex cornetzi TaxID=471704 RepID=A0A151JP42_9HYME|nr:hypothetical protein ALC57_02077 [Trachymyrmex cornetzi]
MDQDSNEEEVLSNDTGFASDASEYNTDLKEKFVPSQEIRALNGRTKHCMIQSYYTTGGALTICAACMVLLTDIDTVGIKYTRLFNKHCENYDFENRHKTDSLTHNDFFCVSKIAMQTVYHCYRNITIPAGGEKIANLLIVMQICHVITTRRILIKKTWKITSEWNANCWSSATRSPLWYISFTKHVDSTKDKNEKNFRKNCVKLRFIDSFKFLSANLDKLASYLDKDKLKIVRSEFSTLSDEEFELLTRKGVFPYEYIDCVEKLQDTRLPPRELFFSLLTGDTISESDYAHAMNVWQRFSIRMLDEYSDLYLKTDVLLLADIFENFRNSCVASYGLDPAYYYTLPGFTWDAMLAFRC